MVRISLMAYDNLIRMNMTLRSWVQYLYLAPYPNTRWERASRLLACLYLPATEEVVFAWKRHRDSGVGEHAWSRGRGGGREVPGESPEEGDNSTSLKEEGNRPGSEVVRPEGREGITRRVDRTRGGRRRACGGGLIDLQTPRLRPWSVEEAVPMWPWVGDLGFLAPLTASAMAIGKERGS